MDTAVVIRHAFGTSVDWSDAYHHVPVHENFKNLLALLSVRVLSVQAQSPATGLHGDLSAFEGVRATDWACACLSIS